MKDPRVSPHSLTRRDFLKLGAGAVAASSLGPLLAACAPAASKTTTINVLVPAAPDPAPPGVAKFSEDAFAKWQQANNAKVVYEAPPWPQLHDKMATNFASGKYVHDIIYMSGWVPEFSQHLVPFIDQLPKDLVADLPPSSFSTVTWNGQKYGVVFTLSLLTLFYNRNTWTRPGSRRLPRPGTSSKGTPKN